MVDKQREADRRTRLLLVDDEPAITDGLAPFLERGRELAADLPAGATALDTFDSWNPDIVVSDVMMPRMDGRELVRRLRTREVWTPIVLLTKVGESVERSAALDEGADDYLNKPFDPQELVSRVRAVLRRVVANQPPLTTADRLVSGDLVFDRTARRIWLSGAEVVLTPRAALLLEYLMGRPGEVHARESLLRSLWGFDFAANTRAIDHRVAEIRRELHDDAADPRFIETAQSLGYRFTGTVTRG